MIQLWSAIKIGYERGRLIRMVILLCRRKKFTCFCRTDWTVGRVTGTQHYFEAEVSRIILRQRDEEAADRAVAHMLQGTVVPLNERLAVDAAYFGVEYKLPLADSIIYATAYRYEAIVWTQDADFKDLKNVRYYPK